MVTAWAGDMVSWVTNAANATDLAETGLTVTPSGTLALNNPGPTPLNCATSVSAACVVHPLGWDWGTSSANGKPVGQQTLTVAFADGTTGTTTDDVYDGFALPCNSGFVFQSGVPVATSTEVGSDVYANCITGNIQFPEGAVLFLNPSQDQYGRYETIMPTVLAEIAITVATVNFPFASIAEGQVYGINTQDGGMAKVYFSETASAGSPINATLGMALHSNSNGTYAF